MRSGKDYRLQLLRENCGNRNGETINSINSDMETINESYMRGDGYGDGCGSGDGCGYGDGSGYGDGDGCGCGCGSN